MGYKMAILGATGLVGREMISILEEKDIPIDNLNLYASDKSQGKSINFKGEELTVNKLEPGVIADCDIYLSSLPGGVSERVLPEIAAKGKRIIIDNSSAFRMKSNIPLIVPEINGELAKDYQGIIANPNCSTIQLVMVLHPLVENFTLKEITVTTLQSVSGSGQQALKALITESNEYLNNKERKTEHYAHPIAFNLLPAIDYFHDNNYSNEEMKMVRETRKILDLPGLSINPTCIRVPVEFGHAEVCQVKIDQEVNLSRIKEILANQTKLKIVDNPQEDIYPMPIDILEDDSVLIGRLRKDLNSDYKFNFYCVANNIRKGAALNAVQIAEKIMQVKLK